MNWPGRALWPLVCFAMACASSDRVEVRPPPTGKLPEPEAAAPPTSSSTLLRAEVLRVLAVDAQPPVRPAAALLEPTVLEGYPIDELELVANRARPESIREAVLEAYRRTAGQYLWSDGRTLSPAARRLLQLLGEVETHGIRARLVDAPMLLKLESALDWNKSLLDRAPLSARRRVPLLQMRAVVLAELDGQLTASALQLARLFSVTSLSGPALANALPEPNDIERWVFDLVPWHPQYRRLVGATRRYRRYRAARWPRVEIPESVEHMGVGGRGPVVARLRTRLRREGFIPGEGDPADPEAFDAVVRDALKRFQYTRGLATNGLLTEATTAALNVPPRRLLAKLRDAQTAWRRSPVRAVTTTVVVNIPEFVVELYRDGERMRRHRVTVGYPFESGGGRTKLFHAAIDRVVLNPGWTPSDEVLNGSLKPRDEANPGYLRREGFRWFTRPDGRRGVYQLPGNRNVLGRVKMQFPNENNIYLHGSPDASQFELATRASSRGCVRVQSIEELAIDLLESDGAMEHAEVEAALAMGKTRVVKLSAPVPIHFEYVLVVVDDDDTIRFLPNVYRR